MSCSMNQREIVAAVTWYVRISEEERLARVTLPLAGDLSHRSTSLLNLWMSPMTSANTASPGPPHTPPPVRAIQLFLLLCALNLK
jgi:hypothetical protein